MWDGLERGQRSGQSPAALWHDAEVSVHSRAWLTPAFQETLKQEKTQNLNLFFLHLQLKRGQILQQDIILVKMELLSSGQHPLNSSCPGTAMGRGPGLGGESRGAPAHCPEGLGPSLGPAESPVRRGPAAPPVGCDRNFALKTLQCFVLPLIRSIWSKCSLGASCQGHKLWGGCCAALAADKPSSGMDVW